MAEKDTRPQQERKPHVDKRDPQALARALDREAAPWRDAYKLVDAAQDKAAGADFSEPLSAGGNFAAALDHLEAFERERAALEEADAPKLEARAAYRVLAAKMGAAWPPVTPSDYREIFFREMVPAFNAAYRLLKLCTECGVMFGVQKHANASTARFCSHKCNRASHDRKRERLTAEARYEKHRSSCSLYKKRQKCDCCVTLFAAAEGAREKRAGDLLDHALKRRWRSRGTNRDRFSDSVAEIPANPDDTTVSDEKR